MANGVLTTQPSAMLFRDKLEQMVVDELLGPAGGPTEELTERPRDRYLVGMLAPRVQAREGSAGAAPADADEDETGEDFPPADELALGGSDSTEDGPTDLSAPTFKAIFPSSFGLTVSIDSAVQELRVTARWGQYVRQASELLVNEGTGNPRRVWRRKPRGGTAHRIVLADGVLAPVAPDPECPDVVIQGRIRRRDDHWSMTLFLVNQQEEKKPKDQWWLFQPVLVVGSMDGSAVFCRRVRPVELSHTDPAAKAEDELLSLLYRRHVEFAVGHGVGVHAETAPDNPTRAVRISTKVVPGHEVPKMSPPTPEDAGRNPAFAKLAGLCLDMQELAASPAGELRSKLRPLLDAYQDWIEREEARIEDPAEDLGAFKDAARTALGRCRATLARIEAGLQLVETDAQAAGAFQFMNRAMALQRTRSLYAERVRRGEKPKIEDVNIPQNRSWYPFQLAFILLNLPGVTQLDLPERSDSPDALADLLWFPTGGGKTEAYLGLTAYTLGLRRLQGTVEGRSGEDGVAVLMRYTLRLLTLQQFQRATALICACEHIRREALEQGDARWGKTPLRIGLWVGRRTTPNRTSESAEAVKLSHGMIGQAAALGGSGTPHQLTNCPWCGSAIDRGKNIKVEDYSQGRCRTLIYCGDALGACLFSQRRAPAEGLPVVVVDEEIYRRLPALLITTVDKFAQMPWNGAVQMLFGQVDGWCDRHGFRSPEIEEASSHTKTRNGLPSVKILSQSPLRPPDLVIQDELHLISGPLGTLVGLYETAVDRLCTWEVHGRPVRPKVIASTATIRRAGDQVHALFARKLSMFPPQGLDIEDNFFAVQRPPSEQHPGRRYLGICAPGRRQKAALIRVYIALLAAGQALFERYGRLADPWMTLVGYFNSLRELGGMKRLVDDDVRTRLRKMDRRGLAKRELHSPDSVKELTSRMGSTAIPETLDLLETPFGASSGRRPLDVLLATNMISVGVDVKRLGLMVVAGQPKTTGEYIQATSRVGRTYPGLVYAVYNWARPRDLSHYETFEHYHATFYKHVEALSVTPFAPGALSRGLAALLVSLVRLQGTEFNPNDRAMLLGAEPQHPYVKEAIERITARAEQVGDRETADSVRAELKRKVDLWQARAQRMSGGATLAYRQQGGTTVGLLQHPGVQGWDEFTCLNSLREVEPSVNLILDDHNLDDEEATVSEPEASEEGSG
jgi:hypothetical protein